MKKLAVGDEVRTRTGEVGRIQGFRGDHPVVQTPSGTYIYEIDDLSVDCAHEHLTLQFGIWDYERYVCDDCRIPVFKRSSS